MKELLSKKSRFALARRRAYKYIFYGMLISWMVGIIHWGIVQSEIFGRRTGVIFVMEDEISGLCLLDVTNEKARKVFSPDEWKQTSTRLHGLSYGWPIRSIGIVIESSSKQWPNGNNERVYIGIDLAHLWKPLPFEQVGDRAFPLYPLIGQSLLSGMIYGTLLWVGLAAWRQYKRRSEVLPCPNCHYELAGNSSDRCPECGNKRAITEKVNSTGTPS